MKLLRNKFVIGIFCILVALVLGFFVLPALQGSGQIVSVAAVRLKASVSAGMQITADLLETMKVSQNLVPNGITDISQAVGKYAKADLYAGDYLTDAKLSGTPTGLSPFSAGMSKGKLVVSLTLPSFASGVSGQLQPGDIVTVIAVPKVVTSQMLGVEPESHNQDTPVIIDPELKYLEVCMVTASDGSDARVQPNPGKDEKNTLPVTVSFFVTETQAKKLAELEQTGTIQLAFVARSEAASDYLPGRVLDGTEVH